jgi:hypothetical protein
MGENMTAEIAGVNKNHRLTTVFFAGSVYGMKTPREILDYCGDDQAIAATLGVSPDRVDRARRDDKLPASWLDALEGLAKRPLDRDAFSFKRPA